ncbi:unnamed protein product [Linum tenue]|uniref:Uncharacterized protein n=1 Tax=Linum tenue TaxID=586396 RepID=A0AAV0QTV2_9ROSI|nr:unnamed protein product [Linum tenue]
MDFCGRCNSDGVRYNSRRRQLECSPEALWIVEVWEKLQAPLGESSKARFEERRIFSRGRGAYYRASCQDGQQMGAHGCRGR